MGEARPEGQSREPGVSPPWAAELSVSTTRMPSAPGNPLQVLTLAQRTAANHIADANLSADVIRRDAQSAAEQLTHDAHLQAEEMRRKAGALLAEARMTTENALMQARSCGDEAAVSADRIIAQAHAEADEIERSARRRASDIEEKARQRFDDAVGRLQARRDALQQQIRALEKFDSDYRSRLALLVQGQLRALWPDLIEVPVPVQAGARPVGSDTRSSQPSAGGPLSGEEHSCLDRRNDFIGDAARA